MSSLKLAAIDLVCDTEEVEDLGDFGVVDDFAALDEDEDEDYYDDDRSDDCDFGVPLLACSWEDISELVASCA